MSESHTNIHKNMKKYDTCIMLITILIVGFSFTTPSTARDWKLSHQRPIGAPLDKDARLFVDNVKKATNGRVSIVIFPANQLGDYSVVQERVSLGDVELMFGTSSSAVDKSLTITAIPYIVKSWEELEYLYSKGGVARDIVISLFNKQDIHLLAVWPAHCTGVSLTKEPNQPENPNIAKGLKVRVMPLKVSELIGEALGYIATPIPFGDVFTALQTGMVEGVTGSGPEGNFSNYGDLIKYYCDQKIFYEPFFLIINKRLWNNLMEEDKIQIEKIAEEMELKRWKEAPKEHIMYIDKLRAKGCTIITFTPQQLDIMCEKIQTEVWPKIPAKEFPSEIRKKIMDALKKMREQKYN